MKFLLLTSAPLEAITSTDVVIPEIVISSLVTYTLVSTPSTSSMKNGFGSESGGDPVLISKLH